MYQQLKNESQTYSHGMVAPSSTTPAGCNSMKKKIIILITKYTLWPKSILLQAIESSGQNTATDPVNFIIILLLLVQSNWFCFPTWPILFFKQFKKYDVCVCVLPKIQRFCQIFHNPVFMVKFVFMSVQFIQLSKTSLTT
jgi:hypothetical protein